MNEKDFWQLIQNAIEASKDDPAKKFARLRDELEKLSSGDVVEYAKHFEQREANAYRWDLWAAAYTIHGGCSDDSFMDFRASLICLGKNVYESALMNPDSLADIDFYDPEASLFFEGYQYLPSEVYKAKTGNKLPATGVNIPQNPKGEEWDEDSNNDLQRICPKLYQKYWE